VKRANDLSERLRRAEYFQNVILSEAKDPRKLSHPAPRRAAEFLRFAQDFGRRLRRRLSASTSFAALSQNDTSKDHCAIHRDATPSGGI
jgi:hypothetical protein